MEGMVEPLFGAEDYDEDYYEDYLSGVGSDTSGELSELYQYCVYPTLAEGYADLVVLFSCCAIFRVVCNAVRTPDTAHFLSSAVGTYMLYVYFRWNVFHTLGLVAGGYCLLLALSEQGKNRGYTTGTLLILYLVGSEKFWGNPETWSKIRGPQMIAAMKIISIAFDLDTRSVYRIGILEYVGYTLCPGSCVWGPWVSFTEYKAKQERVDEHYRWILPGLLPAFLSVFYFVSSNCLIEFFMPNNLSGWWIVYRDALCFRASHYFVSSVSEASTALSGYLDKTVSRPWKIELPRSLAEVVVHWNIPTHKFLKNYVFKTSLSRWGAFVAVMMTYLVSSLLHGLNMRLAAVLLSLGAYTYTEHSVRLKLSSLFDACLGSRRCPSPCLLHTHTQSNLVVNLANIAFTSVAMFHLAYLGVLMENSPVEPQLEHSVSALNRWQELNYVSHWLVLITFLINLLLSLLHS